MSSGEIRRETVDLPPVRRRVREAPAIGLNLTSMIDVVFLLLIYFMVATDFKQAEEVYRLDLPERIEGMSIDPFQLDDEPLRIMVRSTGPGDEDYRIRKVRMTHQKKEHKSDIQDTEIKQIAEIKKKQLELNALIEMKN